MFLKKRQESIITPPRKNKHHRVLEPSKSLVKVVVNNYKQQRISSDIKETSEPLIEHHEGLPRQPTEYLKFPEYDWF
jgi:hypothetical protein